MRCCVRLWFAAATGRSAFCSPARLGQRTRLGDRTSGGVAVVQNPTDAAFPERHKARQPGPRLDLRESPALLENWFVNRPAIRSQRRIRCDTKPRLREMAGQAWKKWIGPGQPLSPDMATTSLKAGRALKHLDRGQSR
jgi:hypothetical protein